LALRFYFDTHIAKAAAIQLRAKGLDVLRCEEVGMADASDADHLEYAAREGRIVVTQDADFSDLHVQWQQNERKHAGILRLPRTLQSEAQISFVVNELVFYHEAEIAGALEFAADIQNRLIYL
jgi:predicted nuclease of predicted toxin-antitoxin system